MLKRLKFVWRAFSNPNFVLSKNEKELRSLLFEIYNWTEHKNISWAKRVRKILGIHEINPNSKEGLKKEAKKWIDEVEKNFFREF